MSVKLIDVNNGGSLRRAYGDSEYFDISVPPIGSVINYYGFNRDRESFTGSHCQFKVLYVVTELQEYWNGQYHERHNVYVERVEDEGSLIK